MASIQKTDRGYRAQVKALGVRDSQIFRTKREAEAWASRRETEIRERATLAPGVLHTLADLLMQYKEEVTPTKRGAAWEERRIDALLKHKALPLKTKVGELTTTMLADFRDARAKEVRPGSVLRDLGVIGAVLDHARREWKWIAANPMTDLKRPAPPEGRTVVIRPWQVRRMLKALRWSPRRPVRQATQAVAACFLMAMRTGMRAGELTGLEWGRVFAAERFCRLLVTKTTPRDVPLSRQALRILAQLEGWDDQQVFGLTQQTLDGLFRKYRTRADLEGFTFHDTRHTAATMLARRLDVLDLCKMFGWADPKQAMTYYNPTASGIAAMLDQRPARGQFR